MNLHEFQLEVNEWADRNFPENKDNKHRPLLGVGEELGELNHAHLKCEQGIRGDASKHQEDRIDAIGDMIIYLANYCGLHDIDLEVAVLTAWQEVKARDWKKNPQDGKI